MLAVTLTSSFVLLTLAEPLSSAERPQASVGAIPFWTQAAENPHATPQSIAAQDALVGLLVNAHITAVRPPEEEVPLEELAALANSNAVRLAVAIRASTSEARCVALHVPPVPPTPEPAPIRDSLEDLQKQIQYADALARAKESRHVADLLAAAVPVCSGSRDDAVDYFLSSTNMPAIVLELLPATPAAASEGPVGERLLERVVRALAPYFMRRGTPHNKGMKLSERGDLGGGWPRRVDFMESRSAAYAQCSTDIGGIVMGPNE